MFSLPDQPQPIGRTLDVGFRLYLMGFKRILPLSALDAVITVAFGLGIQFFDANWPVFVAMLLGLMVISIYFLIAMLASYDAMSQGRPIGLRASLKIAFRKLLPNCGAWLLWSLALVLGLVLLVIPGIIVAITLSLVWCGVVLENLGPVNALKRSHHLVWPGEWWRTFVIVSVPMVILFTAILALYIPLEFIKDLVRSNTVMSVIQNIGEVIIYTLTTPMLYAVLIALYHDLKLRREGSDLFRRIEAANAVAS